jgi:hypothetical protein
MCDIIIPIEDLTEAPLDAAADFCAIHLPEIRHNVRASPASNLVIVFAAAGPEHRAWRLAAIQELAREFAPIRVNGVAGNGKFERDEAIFFLNGAAGVTGQILAV